MFIQRGKRSIISKSALYNQTRILRLKSLSSYTGYVTRSHRKKNVNDIFSIHAINIFDDKTFIGVLYYKTFDIYLLISSMQGGYMIQQSTSL